MRSRRQSDRLSESLETESGIGVGAPGTVGESAKKSFGKPHDMQSGDSERI